MKTIVKFSLPLIVIASMLFGSCNNAEFQEMDDAVYLTNAEGTAKLEYMIVEGTKDVFLTVRAAKIASHDIVATVKVDESFLESYNARYSTSLQLLPKEFYEIDRTTVTIPAGSVSADPVKIVLKELSAEYNKTGFTYALPMSIDKVTGGPEVLESARSFLFALQPIPYADVPEFDKLNVGCMKLAADMPVTTMTMETLICYNSAVISEKWKAHGFVIYNNSATNPNGAGQGIFSRFGDASVAGNILNGMILQKRWDFPATAALTPYKWYHLALTIDATTKQFKWYLDGVQVVSDSYIAAYDLTLNKEKIFFGRENETTTGGSVGIMFSQARLWSVIRTPEQLKNNMYAVDPETPGLVAYWKLNEGSGDLYKDTTGKNPDGVRLGTNPGIWRLNQRIEVGR